MFQIPRRFSRVCLLRILERTDDVDLMIGGVFTKVGVDEDRPKTLLSPKYLLEYTIVIIIQMS